MTPPNTEEADELYCFMSAERVCGPACVAWMVTEVESTSKEMPIAARHCLVLVGVERAGRYLGGLVQLRRQEAIAKTQPSIPGSNS